MLECCTAQQTPKAHIVQLLMHLSKFLLSFLFFVFTVCNFFSLLNQKKKNSPICFLFVCFCFVNFISWRLRESLTVGLNLNRVKRFFICRYFFFPFQSDICNSPCAVYVQHVRGKQYTYIEKKTKGTLERSKEIHSIGRSRIRRSPTTLIL